MYTCEVVSLFKAQAELAFAELKQSCNGLDERGSWKRLTPVDGDYLHSDGTILGQVTHIAGCKVLYASAAFHHMEIRLREITEQQIRIGSNWNKALEYLEESQAYWLKSWEGLSDASLQEMAATNWGDEWPIWKILHTVTAHDSYHAGQIAITRATAEEPVAPPPPMSDEELDFLRTFRAW